ncbi:hypothetical protein COV18_02215 [Candidatus Woesearchaeota archaeon CG10_big_fil_rev_8_21_14_0_10_37_12]|nr:MAG: hypothetical protein COV18_02215 [Candidatus Woesearchaeota archaeon CG10_big_fil_rev_8_21_14_0_10_37_12]
MGDFPENQIKYILKEKWDNSNRVESAITDYFYKEKKGSKPTKTDDFILLFILGINKDGKKAFSTKYSTWKQSKNQNLSNELLKLFFISSLKDKNDFKKKTTEFLKETKIKDFDNSLSPLYLFLEELYLNKKNEFATGIKNSILPLIASLFGFYRHNKVKQFYQMQIDLIDLVTQKSINTYEKIALLLYSENKQFQGIQLNRKDSLEYLKNNNPPVFYGYIKKKYLDILKDFKLWGISAIIGLFAILRTFGLLDFTGIYEGEFFKITGLPIIVNWISEPINLLVLFLLSVIVIGVIKTMQFFKEMKRQ